VSGKIVKVINLKKVYKQKFKEIKAIDGVSFSIKKGEILGFLGPNGAGKSTTLKIMLGLIKATEGKVFINDIEVPAPESRKKIGFLPEHPSFVDTLKGKEVLMFSGLLHNMDKKEIKKKVQELLAIFDLEDAAEREVRKYSKGMLQKIGFASAIIHEPDLLILDEPMSGLDPVARYQFKNMFKQLRKKGKTIFFSSHIIPDVEDLCDRVIIINNGKIVQILDKNEIKNLEEIFIKLTTST